MLRGSLCNKNIFILYFTFHKYWKVINKAKPLFEAMSYEKSSVKVVSTTIIQV